MAFSEKTLREAWRMAQGRCECQRAAHGHGERCQERLTWEHSDLIGPGGWQARPWTPFDEGGEDVPENCEIVCWKCVGVDEM